MRALAIVAALLFAMAAPAYAQKKSDAQKAQDAAREKQEDAAYKASLGRIQAKDAPSSDPWGAVRSDQPQGKAKAPANTAR